MRPSLSLACLAIASTVGLTGCAIIVAPGEGHLRVRTAFGNDAVVGDGRLASDRRAVSAASELEISGPLHVDVRIGSTASLVVEADTNLLPLVRTETGGDTLRVWVERSIRTNNAIRVTYTVPRLSHVRANGSGRLNLRDLAGGALTLTQNGSGASVLAGRVSNLNLQLTGSGSINGHALQTGNANLKLSGSGSVIVGRISAEALNIRLHGSGAVLASGGADHVNAQLTGSGGVNLQDLASQRADLTSDGSGDITARVAQALVAQTSGSGRITVYGNPAQRQVTGKHVQVLN